MNAARVRKLNVGVFLDEVVQIRLVLEKVGVKFLVVERDIRLNVVVELDDLKINARVLEVCSNNSACGTGVAPILSVTSCAAGLSPAGLSAGLSPPPQPVKSNVAVKVIAAKNFRFMILPPLLDTPRIISDVKILSIKFCGALSKFER